MGIEDALPGLSAAYTGVGQDIGDAYRRNKGLKAVGAAAGQVARGVPVYAVAAGDDLMRSAATVLDPAAQALKTFVTGDSAPIGASSAPTVAQNVPAPAQAVAAPARPVTTPAALAANDVSAALPQPDQPTIGAAVPPEQAAARERVKQAMVKLGLMPDEVSKAQFSNEGGIGATYTRGSGEGRTVFGAGDPNVDARASYEAERAPFFNPAVADTGGPSPQDWRWDPRLRTPTIGAGVDLTGVSRGRAARISADLANNAAREDTARRGQDVQAQTAIATNLPAQTTAQANLERERAQAPLYAAQATEAQARATREGVQTKSLTADEKRKTQITDLQDQLANETDPKKISVLEKRLNTMQGKIAELYQPITGKDLEGNTTIIGVLDKRTGQVVKPEAKDPSSDPKALSVKADLAAGKIKPDEARKRLQAMGYQ